ncbi:NAD(P)H-binding protein [Microbispora siamensis]
MIVISAASGALGRLVIEQLRTRTEVVAAVRDPGRAPEGVTARRGDYDDPASLREAFDGAARLLLISSPELDTARRIGQHGRLHQLPGGRHRRDRHDGGLSRHRAGHTPQRPAVHVPAPPLLQRRVRPAGRRG